MGVKIIRNQIPLQVAADNVQNKLRGCTARSTARQDMLPGIPKSASYISLIVPNNFKCLLI
jgi:hypothetical protein